MNSTLPPLLPARVVHDRRHVSIWLALTFAAGAVNATSLAACQRFVTHVTGTLTQTAADFGQPFLMLEYGCVLVCFVVGAMTSAFFIDARRMRGLDPQPVAMLVLVALVLVAVGWSGALGLFGTFGLGVETTSDFVLLSVLGFAMGLQNAAVATTTGMIVRTTHMTGPLTDFSIALTTMLTPGPPSQVRAARRSALLRGAKIGSFFVGCVVGSYLAPELRFATFFVPAAAVAFSAAMLRRTLSGTEQEGRFEGAVTASWQ